MNLAGGIAYGIKRWSGTAYAPARTGSGPTPPGRKRSGRWKPCAGATRSGMPRTV